MSSSKPADPVDESVLNTLLANFLISQLPKEEQQVPRLWLHRLTNPAECLGRSDTECRTEKNNKEVLLHYFLRSLLRSPLPKVFLDPPDPAGTLPDVPEDERTLRRAPSNIRWAERLAHMDIPEETKKPSHECSKPSDFFATQPKPRNGAFCYAGVFSD